MHEHLRRSTRSGLPTPVVAALAAVVVACAAAAGAVSVFALRGGHEHPVSRGASSADWRRQDRPTFSLETPADWRIERDRRGTIMATGGPESVRIRPVFVDAQLDERGAETVSRHIAENAQPALVWTALTGAPHVARLVGRSGDIVAISLFTYVPTARGTAGYVFTATAPRGRFARSRATFARIIGSFEARGSRVAAAPMPRYERWTDPAEGAFSVEIPAGWTASGGTERPSALLVQATVQATSSDSEVTALMTDALPLYVEPNATLAYAGIGEGGTYTDPTGYSSPVRTYAPGAQYLRDYVLPERGVDATITRLKDRPDLAARLATYGINSYDAGEIEYTFERDGVPYTGGAVAITERLNLSGYTAWHVWRLFLTEAPTARYGDGVAALGRLAGSFAIDPAWARRQSETTAQQSGIIARMSDDVSETLSSGYWERQRVQDELSERRARATLEVEDVVDEETGSSYRVDSGSSYYWIDPHGTIVGTDTDTRPDVDFRSLVRLDV